MIDLQNLVRYIVFIALRLISSDGNAKKWNLSPFDHRLRGARVPDNRVLFP